MIMSTSETHRPFVNADVVRRLIHVVVLISLIVGVRACGGAASAEDRLGAGTQWFTEKTGLAAVKARWDKSIRPPLAAMTGSASTALYGAVARSLDQASSITDQTAAWTRDTAGKAVDAVASGIRRIFMPGAPPPQREPDPQEEAKPTSPPTP
jgi:hypothetical protein